MDAADGAIVVKDADFHWGPADSFHLLDINFVALKVSCFVEWLVYWL